MKYGMRKQYNGKLNYKSEKHSLVVFYKKRCSYKFHKIHKKTPVPESLF